MKYGIFNTLQKLIEKSEDINLMYQFQHDIINYEIQQRRERERMIEEITQKVLSRISTTIDTSKAIDNIKELKKIIDDLENKIGEK